MTTKNPAKDPLGILTNRLVSWQRLHRPWINAKSHLRSMKNRISFEQVVLNPSESPNESCRDCWKSMKNMAKESRGYVWEQVQMDRSKNLEVIWQKLGRESLGHTRRRPEASGENRKNYVIWPDCHDAEFRITERITPPDWRHWTWSFHSTYQLWSINKWQVKRKAFQQCYWNGLIIAGFIGLLSPHSPIIDGPFHANSLKSPRLQSSL